MAVGVVTYMLLFYAGLASLTSSSYPSPCSPYSLELIGGGVFGLPPGFCYLCVGMARLFPVGEKIGL